MRKLHMDRDALKFFQDLDAKQYRQVGRKIFSLVSDPQPADSSKLKGYDFWRVDLGEYRIIYRFDDETVYIALVGKRNDDEVYKDLAKK
jgi:mRNA interferase RelE/StbE